MNENPIFLLKMSCFIFDKLYLHLLAFWYAHLLTKCWNCLKTQITHDLIHYTTISDPLTSRSLNLHGIVFCLFSFLYSPLLWGTQGPIIFAPSLKRHRENTHTDTRAHTCLITTHHSRSQFRYSGWAFWTFSSIGLVFLLKQSTAFAFSLIIGHITLSYQLC